MDRKEYKLILDLTNKLKGYPQKGSTVLVNRKTLLSNFSEVEKYEDVISKSYLNTPTTISRDLDELNLVCKVVDIIVPKNSKSKIKIVVESLILSEITRKCIEISLEDDEVTLVKPRLKYKDEILVFIDSKNEEGFINNCISSGYLDGLYITTTNISMFKNSYLFDEKTVALTESLNVPDKLINLEKEIFKIDEQLNEDMKFIEEEIYEKLINKADYYINKKIKDFEILVNNSIENQNLPKKSLNKSAFDSDQHCIIDIETLSTTMDCVITEIGAIKFNPKTGEIFARFKINIQIQNSLDLGFVISEPTMKFWMNQDEKVRDEVLYNENAVPVKVALDKFREWIESNFNVETYQIWGNSETFDLAKMIYHYEFFNEERCWNFREERCCRTIKQIDRVLYDSLKTEKGLHTTLVDCETHIKGLSLVINKYNI